MSSQPHIGMRRWEQDREAAVQCSSQRGAHQHKVKDRAKIYFPFPKMKVNANILSGKRWSAIVEWQFTQFIHI